MNQSPVTDFEIMADTFRVIRNEQLSSVEQVRRAMREMFPDIPEERRQKCLSTLADRLIKANPDVRPPSRRRS